MTAALAIILFVILASTAVGVLAGRRQPLDLESWTVGGRRFGVLLIWLLMAGEVYTTFTFLGASGWAYTRGAPVFYIPIYGTLAYVLSFFILPRLWRIGKSRNLHTQPDFFAAVYGSRPLAMAVALIGIASILPYLQLQLKGLGLIVEVASGGAVSSSAAIAASFVLTCAFVFTSGLRGTAWVSVIKDVLMIAAVGIVGIGVPLKYFGGFGALFRELAARHPGHLVFPGAAPGMNVPWVMSTVLVTGAGFYMWPHMVGSAFSAKNENVLRRNAIIMPVYQLFIFLVFVVGFTALLVVPGLKNGDLAFLTLVQKAYPAWFLGFVGAAGAVTAMVPASVLVLFASTLLAKNVYQAGFRPQADERSVMKLSRALVLVIMAVALVFALIFPSALVNLLLIGYDGVSQFFPGMILGLFWKGARAAGVLTGLLAGIGVVAVLVFTGHDPWAGLNAGFIALAVNAAITVGVSLALGQKPDLSR
ncbi:MAG: sodium:solute symporter family protein [Candidatus Aminicenantales bacterium]